MIPLIKSFSMCGKSALLVIFGFILLAVFSQSVSPHPHDRPSGGAFTPPNAAHILGTDDLGVDLFSQIALGAKTSLWVGFATAGLSGIIGAFVGMLAGYRGGFVDRVCMRVVDGMMVLPDLPVMIVLAAFFGPGLWQIITVLSLFSWVFTARIIRSRVMVVRHKNYLRYAKMSGAGFFYLMRVHLFPEIYPLLSVSIIRLAGKAIVAEAGLSFLGLGDPMSRSWGLIIHHATRFNGIYFTDFWLWWLLSPVCCLCLLIMALAYVCRDLETLADSRLPLRGAGY